MSKKPIKVKEVARSEMQSEKSWLTEGPNLAFVLLLSLLTILAIFFAARLLGPADEVADALRDDDEMLVVGKCELAGGQVLLGELPTPSSIIGPDKPQWAQPFPLLIDPGCDYRATIVTNRGPIEVELYEQESPHTVNNFVALAESGFYDGIAFHRVIPGFVAQAGDPLGSGMGGPGYRFADEFNEAGYIGTQLRHDQPGVLSMANSGPNTNGSQFFITYAPTPHLDPFEADGQLRPCGAPSVSCHAIFGQVVGGMDVASSLAPYEPGAPGEPDVIQTIQVTATPRQ